MAWQGGVNSVAVSDRDRYDYSNASFGQTGTLNGLPGPSAIYPGMPGAGDIPHGDFTWDQSYVGSYDPATASTFASLINNTAGGSGSGSGSGSGKEGSSVEGPQPAAAGGSGGSGSGAAQAGASISASASASDVLGGIMEQKKWGSRGGAPMFNTPNCESSPRPLALFMVQLVNPMLISVSVLLPWFPTAEERSLILHYCANAADLMMAIPSGLNPMLAINLPLALDSPRGQFTSP